LQRDIASGESSASGADKAPFLALGHAPSDERGCPEFDDFDVRLGSVRISPYDGLWRAQTLSKPLTNFCSWEKQTFRRVAGTTSDLALPAARELFPARGHHVCPLDFGPIEMALHVLAYNLTRVMNIIGVQPLLAAIRA
jgi:hypothetical protein